MGISFSRRFCYFGPARTGSHAVQDRLQACLGKDFMLFRDNSNFDVFLETHGDSYFEFNGDHCRAVTIHRLFPETLAFRSAATFRDPFRRVESLFCFTAAQSGAEISQMAFERWVDLVFCNPFNPVNRAHRLQADIFMNDLGIPCVDRVYDTERLDELIGYLLGPEGHDEPLPIVNGSAHSVGVGMLGAAVLNRLVSAIAPDIAFWETLQASHGVWRTD